MIWQALFFSKGSTTDRDHTMKGRALVVQRLSRLSDALLARAKSTKVLRRLRDNVSEKLERNTAYINGVELVPRNRTSTVISKHGAQKTHPPPRRRSRCRRKPGGWAFLQRVSSKLALLFDWAVFKNFSRK